MLFCSVRATPSKRRRAAAHVRCGRRDASSARPPGDTTTRGHVSGAVAQSGAGKKPVTTAASVTVVEPKMSTCYQRDKRLRLQPHASDQVSAYIPTRQLPRTITSPPAASRFTWTQA